MQKSIDGILKTLGTMIGREIRDAISEQLQAQTQPKVHTQRKADTGRRSSSSAKPCVVPNCSRSAAAKGLCAGHYAKASVLKLDKAALSKSDLRTLAADLRKVRSAGSDAERKRMIQAQTVH